MPGRRRGPHASVRAALLGGLILAVLAAPACREEPKPTYRFAVEMEPLAKITGYGQIVPFRITIRSDSSIPVFVHRVEAVTGWRRVVGRLSERVQLAVRRDGDALALDETGAEESAWVARTGLVTPGGSVSIEVPYRLIDGKEGIFFTYEAAPREDLLERVWFPDPGRPGRWVRDDPAALDAYTPGERILVHPRAAEDRVIREAGQRVKVPCPPAPFEPQLEVTGNDGWSYSLALDGFVVRISSAQFQLHRADGVTPLPPVPLDFFEDLDLARDGVKVVTERGRVTVVRAADAASFLEGVFRARRSIGFSNQPEIAKYEIKE